jgi:hypothetical protein
MGYTPRPSEYSARLRYHRWRCQDCAKFCDAYTADYYAVYDGIWAKACATKPEISTDCLLCLSCLSRRLRRPLVRRDFPPHLPINNGFFAFDRERMPLWSGEHA